MGGRIWARGSCGQQLKTVALTQRDLCTLLAKSNKQIQGAGLHVQLPVNLLACHLQSLSTVADLSPSLSLSLFLFLSCFPHLFIHVSVRNGVCVCMCVFVPTFPTWMAGLDPGKHLGKPLADMEPYLKQVSDWQIFCHFSFLYLNISPHTQTQYTPDAHVFYVLSMITQFCNDHPESLVMDVLRYFL